MSIPLFFIWIFHLEKNKKKTIWNQIFQIVLFCVEKENQASHKEIGKSVN